MKRWRPWSGSDRRCRAAALGPFYTDWRCLLPHDHAEVEGLPHIFEPDIWLGGEYHDQWVARVGETGLSRPLEAPLRSRPAPAEQPRAGQSTMDLL